MVTDELSTSPALAAPTLLITLEIRCPSNPVIDAPRPPRKLRRSSEILKAKDREEIAFISREVKAELQSFKIRRQRNISLFSPT